MRAVGRLGGLGGLGVVSGGPGGPPGTMVVLGVPAGFPWTPPFSVTLDTDTLVGSTSYGLTADRPDPTGWREEWADPAGSTVNTSSTPASRVSLRRAIQNAVAAATNTIIRAAPGIYRGSLGFDGQNMGGAFNLIIEPDNGTGRIVSPRAGINTVPAYTKTAGRTNIYQMALAAAPNAVVDFGTTVEVFTPRATGVAISRYLKMAQQPLVTDLAGTLTALDAAPGSWYHDTGILYVHASGSRDASQAVVGNLIQHGSAGINGNFSATNNNVKLWIKNVDFIGGAPGFTFVTTGSGLATCTLVSCTFQGGTANAAQCIANGRMNLIGCYAGDTLQDGFSYSGEAGTGGGESDPSPDVFEWSCFTRACGGSAGNNNNGSTSHGGCNVIRVDGDYRGASDRTVHDVGGCEAWTVGGFVGKPTKAPGTAFSLGGNVSTACVALGGAGVGTPNHWLDGVTIEAGADDDLQELGGAIKVTTRTVYNAGNVTGTIDTYVG